VSYIVGYTYDAGVHCDACAAERFGRCQCEHHDVHGEDSEGNDVEPIFATDEAAGELTCDDCGSELMD
jgi:hypothetical protein